MLRAVATACGAECVLTPLNDQPKTSSGKRSRRRKPSPDLTPHEAP
jgi:predicted xylose isomerase-like sugar epimerase